MSSRSAPASGSFSAKFQALIMAFIVKAVSGAEAKLQAVRSKHPPGR